MAGPWEQFAPQDDGPWTKFAAPVAQPPLHDVKVGAFPAPPAQPPLHDANLGKLPTPPAWTPPLGYHPTGEVASASDRGPMTMGAGPLVRAMLDENRPIGQRVLAGAGHVASDILRAGPDAVQSALQSLRAGEQPSPEAIGSGAMAMLPGALETGGLKAAPKLEAPAPRIEPPPLNETRARVAGAEAVGKVADRVATKPWEQFAEPKTEVLPAGVVVKPEDLGKPEPRRTRPPAPPPAKPNEDPWDYWKRAFSTPEAKAAMKNDSLKVMLAENYHGVPTKGDPEKYEGKDYWKKSFPDAKPAAAAPPVMPVAPAVPKKTASPKIKPTIPPGTDPHVAKLVEKGNNFFADQFATQPKTELPMTQAARVKRAKQMGFNTGLNLYHGTSKNFIQFEIDKAKAGEYAIFTSDKPGISAMYGGKHVLPLWGKFENPKTIENFGSYNNAKMLAAIKQAKAEGYSELILKNMTDLGGKQTQYLFFKPENLRARDAAVFDPKQAKSPNLLSAAAAAGPHAMPPGVTLPAKSMSGTVKKLADDLYRLVTKHEKAKEDVLDQVRELPPQALDLGEKFFNYLEPGPNKPTLSPQEKSIFDKYLKPWLQKQRDLYEEIKKLNPSVLPADYDPDYVHHLVQGKTPEFDEQIGAMTHEPNSPWFGSKTLPRSTRSLKNSKYYVLDDGITRQVVMLDDKGNLYKMQGKQPINVPPKDIQGDVEAGQTISIGGKKWEIKRASVAEKEGATNLKYYKNAYLSTLSNVVRLQKVAEALHHFEVMKSDPEFMQFARRPGDKRATPKGWTGTTLPGWEGWRFDPHLREVMDDWHNKPREEWYENLKNLTHGVVGTLFLTPFRHMLNVGGHYYVGRMGDLVTGNMLTGRHFANAIWDTLKQGPLTKQMLDTGSALQLPRVLNAEFNKQLLKGLENNFKSKPKDWKWLWNKLNVKEEDIYNGWMKASSVAMWYVSDVMMQALVRERMAQGMGLEQAIRSAEKDIPNYRINPRVMMDNQAGRAMSRYLQNSLFSVFGRYNNNKWRAIADMVNDVMRGATPKERAEGVGKALALMSLVYMVYWPIDSAVKQLTGRKDKRSSPFGPTDPIDKMKQLGEFISPEVMKRLGATDDQVQATQLLQSFIGLSPALDEAYTQITGHNPYTNQPISTLGERGQAAIDTLSPAQIASDIAGGKVSPLEELLKLTIGERSVPKPPPYRIVRQEQNAAAKRRNKEPVNRFLTEAQRKLQPFTPDAIIKKFLPSQ